MVEFAQAFGDARKRRGGTAALLYQPAAQHFDLVSNVTVNEPLDSERFVFVVPEGVDVVGTPVIAEIATP